MCVNRQQQQGAGRSQRARKHGHKPSKANTTPLVNKTFKTITMRMTMTTKGETGQGSTLTWPTGQARPPPLFPKLIGTLMLENRDPIGTQLFMK